MHETRDGSHNAADMAYLFARGWRSRTGADLGVLAGSGGPGRWRTLLVIDGLDHVARFTPAADAAGRAPGPGRCTGWRGNRAGVTDDGPPGRAGTASPDRTCWRQMPASLTWRTTG